MENPSHADMASYSAILVETSRIYFDKDFNCRGDFSIESIRQLADSITEVGRLLTPLWVQPACDVVGLTGYDFRLLAGHRRFRAITMILKWTSVPVMVFPGLTTEQATLLNFVENLEREDLNPLQEARTMGSLFGAYTPVAHICRALKRPDTWVKSRLLLLRAPEEVQQMVATKRIPLTALRSVMSRKSPAEQIRAAQTIAQKARGADPNDDSGEIMARSAKRRPNSSDALAKIEYMMSLGIAGLPCRIVAWMLGKISENELNRDIQRFVESNLESKG